MEGNVHDDSGRKRRNDGFKAYADGKQCDGRNKRSVWTVTTKPYKEAHFATFPPDLIAPCIKAGSRKGDIVLDPFGGSMTTAYVSKELNRKAIMIELNVDYVEMGTQRLSQEVLPL
jgi:DNA modification methylase